MFPLAFVQAAHFRHEFGVDICRSCQGKRLGSKLEVPEFLQDFVEDISTANTAMFVEAGPIKAAAQKPRSAGPTRHL